MNASVIIPVWNGRQYLPECLEALLAQIQPAYEIIVVDNASSDGSAEFITQSFPQVTLVQNKRNLGFAGGCNAGIRTARGDPLILLNQDTRVFPNWLSAIGNMLRYPRVGVAGCKLLYPDGKTLQHAGGWVEWPLGLARHYGYREPDEGQWDTAGPADFVTGAAMAIRREVIEKVGFLDEEFWPGYFEDIDFCFRSREADYQVWYFPEAALVHHETTSVPDPNRVSRLYQRGRLRFVLKHCPPKQFLDEFVPAEIEYQLPAIRGRESLALRLAYLEAIAIAPILVLSRWQSEHRTAGQVIDALGNLHRRAWKTERQVIEEILRQDAASYPQTASLQPLSQRLRDLAEENSYLAAGLVRGAKKGWPIQEATRRKGDERVSVESEARDPNEIIAIDDPEIDVDALMQEIRASLRSRRSQAQALGLDFDALASGEWDPPPGGRFRSELYESLSLANRQYDKMLVSANVSPSRLPLIGSLVNRLKRPFHLLVVYYLHQFAGKQIPFNNYLVQSLTRLVEDLEQPDESAPLYQELAELERRVQRLESAASKVGDKPE